MADARGVRDLPFEQDWVIAKATTFYAEYTLQLDGSAWDLNDATITLQVNTEAGAKKFDADCAIDSKDDGTWHIELTTTETDIDEANYDYAVKIVLDSGDDNFASGATFILLEGKFIVGANAFAT